MDVKAQISAEYILLVGFILVIVLIFATFIGEQNELNSVMTAAKEGASDAISELSFLNRAMQPVRVTNMTLTGNENKTIQIRLSRTLSPDNKDFVANRSLSYIAKLGYTRDGNTITSGRYQYTVVILP
ncbi:MAG: class III signal peptide-containing protein [Methanomicrobiales archaeon]